MVVEGEDRTSRGSQKELFKSPNKSALMKMRVLGILFKKYEFKLSFWIA